jgi:hypothetical protein
MLLARVTTQRNFYPNLISKCNINNNYKIQTIKFRVVTLSYITERISITPNLVKIGQQYRAIYMETSVCFILLVVMHLAQQYTESVVVLHWQHFRYLLHS